MYFGMGIIGIYEVLPHPYKYSHNIPTERDLKTILRVWIVAVVHATSRLSMKTEVARMRAFGRGERLHVTHQIMAWLAHMAHATQNDV